MDIIRTDILPHSSELPKDFIASLVQLLNKGSVHTSSGGTLHHLLFVLYRLDELCVGPHCIVMRYVMTCVCNGTGSCLSGFHVLTKQLVPLLLIISVTGGVHPNIYNTI